MEALMSSLDDLFDIAHQDALKNTNEEDEQFLLLLREKERTGCMRGVDIKFLQAKEQRAQRKAAETVRLEK